MRQLIKRQEENERIIYAEVEKTQFGTTVLKKTDLLLFIGAFSTALSVYFFLVCNYGFFTYRLTACVIFQPNSFCLILNSK